MTTETTFADVELFFKGLTKTAVTFRLDQVPFPAPETPGVYVLIERETPVYVGRTGNLRKRLLQHRRPSVKRGSLASTITRLDVRESGEDEDDLYAAAHDRVRAMRFRYVEVPEDRDDGACQALLEIYAALQLGTLRCMRGYNEFRNH